MGEVDRIDRIYEELVSFKADTVTRFNKIDAYIEEGKKRELDAAGMRRKILYLILVFVFQFILDFVPKISPQFAQIAKIIQVSPATDSFKKGVKETLSLSPPADASPAKP